MNKGLSPIDPTTPVGQVRLVIGDTDAIDVDSDGYGEFVYYSDRELESLLGLYGGNVKRTAARIYRTIAASEVLLHKKFVSADLSADSSVVSKELRLLADALEREADSDAADGAEVFLISDRLPNVYTSRPWDEVLIEQTGIAVF